jgi:hypothetical protein
MKKRKGGVGNGKRNGGALQSDTLLFGASAAHPWAIFLTMERWQLV